LQSVVTIGQCQAVQQCYVYLHTYYPTVTRVPDKLPDPITAALVRLALGWGRVDKNMFSTNFSQIKLIIPTTLDLDVILCH